jgi:CysZ protein
MKTLLLGLKSPFVGVKLILAHKELKRLAIIPLLIDLVLFIGVLYASLFVLMPTLMSSLLTGATGFWASVVYYGSYALATVILFILSGFLTFALAMVISAPFNALLAERALVILGALPQNQMSVGAWLSQSTRMLLVALIRSLVVLSIAGLMFLLGFIPGLGAVALFVSLFIFATDCADYSLEVLGTSLKDRFRSYRSHFLGFSGFGLSLGLTFLIPGLSFLIMPAAVVGGAHFIKELRTIEHGPKT